MGWGGDEGGRILSLVVYLSLFSLYRPLSMCCRALCVIALSLLSRSIFLSLSLSEADRKRPKTPRKSVRRIRGREHLRGEWPCVGGRGPWVDELAVWARGAEPREEVDACNLLDVAVLAVSAVLAEP